MKKLLLSGTLFALFLCTVNSYAQNTNNSVTVAQDNNITETFVSDDDAVLPGLKTQPDPSDDSGKQESFIRVEVSHNGERITSCAGLFNATTTLSESRKGGRHEK